MENLPNHSSIVIGRVEQVASQRKHSIVFSMWKYARLFVKVSDARVDFWHYELYILYT